MNVAWITRLLSWIIKISFCFKTYCVSALPGCMHVPHMYAVPRKARRGHQIPRNWSYKWWATMWVLRIKLGSSGRAVSALNHPDNFTAPQISFCSMIFVLQIITLMYICVWGGKRPGVYFGCFPQFLSTLSLETRSLIQPEASPMRIH